MSSIAQFNSHLLDTLKTEWQGLFYDKFFRAFTVLEEQKDLEQAIKSLFSEMSSRLAHPWRNDVKTFGRGNQAQDAKLLQYLDHALAQGLLGYTGFFLDENYLTPKVLNESPLLKKYAIFQRFIHGEPLPQIKINSLDDLAFMGCLGMLELYLLQTGKEELPKLSYKTNTTTQNQINYLQIDSSPIDQNIQEIIEQGKNPQILIDFLSFNQGAITIEKSPLQLNQAVSEILASSSFLWQDNVFNVSPEEVSSMSEEKRIFTLVQNKTAVIERCFDHLHEFFRQEKKPHAILDLQNQLRLGFDLSNLIEKRFTLQNMYSSFHSKARQLKQKFLQLAESQGLEEKNSSRKLLQMFTLREFEINRENLLAVDQLLIDILLEYKQNVIEGEKYQQHLNDVDQEIKGARAFLEKKFTSNALGPLRAFASMSQQARLELLKVYATFSFVLLNKDLFPVIPLKKEVLKKGSEKVSKTLKKLSLKKAFGILKSGKTGIQKLREEDTFDQLINPQILKVFRGYNPQTKRFKSEEPLLEKDVASISKTAKLISRLAEENQETAVSRYLKLEKILEELLMKQQGFYLSIKQLRPLEAKRLQSLQSHMYALLIFANHPDQLFGEKAGAIKDLLKSIADNLTNEGIKEKLVESNKKILQSAEELALNFEPDDIETLNEKVIIGKNYEQLKNLALVPTARPNPYKKGTEERKKRVEKLLEEIDHTLNSKDYTWWNEVIGLDDLTSSAFYQEYENEPLPYEFWKKVQQELGFVPSMPKTMGELLKIFRQVIIENNILINPRRSLKSSSIALYRTPIQKAENVLAKAMAIYVMKKEIAMGKEHVYTVTLQSKDPLSGDRQVDVFNNQSLFQLHERNNILSEQNERLSEGIYWEYLPIFISSFLAGQKIFQSEFFVKAKAQFLEQLPGARSVIHDVEKYLRENAQGIQELQNYLKEEIAKNAESLRNDPDAIADFFESIMTKGKDLFKQYVGIPLQQFGNYILEASIVSASLLSGLVLGGFVPGLTAVGGAILFASITLLSFVGVAFLQRTVLPYVKKFLNTLLEGIQYLAKSGRYQESAPMDYLLTTLKLAMEVESSAFEKFEEIGHQVQFGSFVQQLYMVFGEMGSDLNAFKERINQLVPATLSQANFSVMALNMMGFLNKEAFQLLPQKLLKKANHPSFQEATKDYLQSYKLALAQAGRDFEGVKEMTYSHETPYSRYLKSQTIELTFTENSPVGESLGNRPIKFRLESEDIIPYQEINPEIIAENLEKLSSSCKKLSQEKNLFEQKFRPVLQKMHGAMNKPLREEEKSQFTNAFLASFEMVRYGFSLGKALADLSTGVPTELRKWFKATKENPTSIFTSRLFETSLNFLEKTAFALSTTTAPDRLDFIMLVKELRQVQQDFLQTGILNLPPSSVLQSLEDAVLNVIAEVDDYPGVAIPGLLELESNKSLFVPLVIWQAMKHNLEQTYGEEAVNVLALSNRSKALYLTGQDLNLFFASPELRGNLFNIWTVNALENISKRFTNRQLRQFLGHVNSNIEAFERVPTSVISKMPWMQKRLPEQKALPGSNAPEIEPIYPGQRYVQPNRPSREVNPETGLSPAQYDPENRGLSPQDALSYYRDRLPEGVQNQIIQSTGREPPISQSLPSNQGVSQLGQNTNQPERRLGETPQIMPMMMPSYSAEENMQPMMEQPSQEVNQQPIEQPPTEANQPIMVGVGSDGSSRSFSAGANVQDEQFAEQLRDQADMSRRNLQDMQNQPSGIPQGSGNPYINPINENYEPVLPQENQIPWGNALMIGAGAALGAGALGYALSGGNKKEGKRRR